MKCCAEGDTLRSKDGVSRQNAGGEARLLPSAQAGDTLVPYPIVTPETCPVFRNSTCLMTAPTSSAPTNAVSAAPLDPQKLSDDALISAIPDATLAGARALATEAGARRLSAAVPALTSLCNRFVGWGADVVVPEQVAALNALGVIGSPEAAHAVSRLISRRIVQGPTLVTATTVASQLGVVFPSDVVLALLRHSNPLVRAAACACVRSGYEVITTLIAMLNDPDGEVATASACALGRMGRTEAQGHLKRYLSERPSPRDN